MSDRRRVSVRVENAIAANDWLVAKLREENRRLDAEAAMLRLENADLRWELAEVRRRLREFEEDDGEPTVHETPPPSAVRGNVVRHVLGLLGWRDA